MGRKARPRPPRRSDSAQPLLRLARVSRVARRPGDCTPVGRRSSCAGRGGARRPPERQHAAERRRAHANKRRAPRGTPGWRPSRRRRAALKLLLRRRRSPHLGAGAPAFVLARPRAPRPARGAAQSGRSPRRSRPVEGGGAPHVVRAAPPTQTSRRTWWWRAPSAARGSGIASAAARAHAPRRLAATSARGSARWRLTRSGDDLGRLIGGGRGDDAAARPRYLPPPASRGAARGTSGCPGQIYIARPVRGRARDTTGASGWPRRRVMESTRPSYGPFDIVLTAWLTIDIAFIVSARAPRSRAPCGTAEARAPARQPGVRLGGEAKLADGERRRRSASSARGASSCACAP